jgi:hypothetical protein
MGSPQTLSCISLAVLLIGCPGGPDDDDATECVPLGTARLVSGPEPSFIGPLSNPQSGDAYLANDRVQVLIQGPGRSLGMNPWGGNITDADRVREDGTFRDVFGEVAPFINLAGTSSGESVSVLSDGSCGEPAAVRVQGTYVLSDYINLTTGINTVLPGALDGVDIDAQHPLRFVTTYTAQPGANWIDVSITTTNEGAEAVPWLLVWLAEAGITRGFVPGDEGWSLNTFGGAEYFVFAGQDVAYGVLPRTPERRPARGYVSLVGGFALSHDKAALDIFAYPDSADVIASGRERTDEMAFVVGSTHAEVVQTIQGLLGATCAVVQGTVTEEGGGPIAGAFVSAIAVEAGVEEADLSRTRSGDDGSYSLCLPPGSVRLIAGQEGRPYSGAATTPGRTDVDVPATGAIEVDLSLPPTGALQAAVTDGQGAPLPSRLTVYGVDPSPHTYRLDGDGFDPRAPGVTVMLDSVDGTFDLALEPGEYDAVFTRGPEYTLDRQQISVAAGNPVALTATLHRVVDTAGYLSGDFHVHAHWSPDSQIANTDRVANMAAEGVEILVSTDHAFVTDYAPDIDQLGLGGWITSVPGQEITTFDYGHFNGFPLLSDPGEHNRGAIDWPGMSPEDINTSLNSETQVFQVNHPRAVPAPGEGNYFNNVDLQFDADGPYVGSDARDPLSVRLAADAQMLVSAFVAVEVMTWLDVQGLHDWFNFLNAGVRFTATGNSDTHTLRVESSGWPRNFVRLGEDTPSEMAPEDLVLAMHSGRNVISFGPFVRLAATGTAEALVGDTVQPNTSGEVAVTVNVQAPPWIPFDSVELLDGATNTVLAGGAVVPQLVSAGAAPEAQRLELQIDHTFTPTADTWLVVVVTGSQGLFPGIAYNTSDPATLDIEGVRAGNVDGPATAFAATNPIFVDADADGAIEPSHLVLPADQDEWRWEDRTNPY